MKGRKVIASFKPTDIYFAKNYKDLYENSDEDILNCSSSNDENKTEVDHLKENARKENVPLFSKVEVIN